jgi:hypothetical protein
VFAETSGLDQVIHLYILSISYFHREVEALDRPFQVGKTWQSTIDAETPHRYTDLWLSQYTL